MYLDSSYTMATDEYIKFWSSGFNYYDQLGIDDYKNRFILTKIIIL